MKSFKYTINGNVYKVHISSVVDDIAEVEVNGTPYQVKMEKPAKKTDGYTETPGSSSYNGKWRTGYFPSGSLNHQGRCQISAARCNPAG